MRILILYIISISLAAIADACMDSGGKLIGHSAEETMILRHPLTIYTDDDVAPVEGGLIK